MVSDKDVMSKENSMKTIVFSAPTLTLSGYGVHARQVAKWLLKKELEGKCKVLFHIVPWGDTPWVLDANRYDGLIGKIMERSAPPSAQCDASIQLKLPNEFETKIAHFNIGMTAAVETDRCNLEWITACNKMNMLIVPSAHVEKTLRASGNLTVPTHVIPEAYPECFRTSTPVELPLKLDNYLNFLIFGQITGNNPDNDRKNTFYTIKWLCEAFRDENVGIIVKTNICRNTRIDKRLVTSTFTQLLKQIRRGKTPTIHLLHGDMSDVEVFSLLKHPKVSGLVSLTRGEGFGLPILEASACGLPIIATNWSAHTEFLGHGRFIPVDYTLTNIHESRIDNKIFMNGAKWAFPNEATFKKLVKKFQSSSAIPKQWARDLSNVILEKYSQESIEKYYDSTIGIALWS
jgi:hypothetical protein